MSGRQQYKHCMQRKILLVDDDEILCKFLQLQFSQHNYALNYLSKGEYLPHLLNRKQEFADIIVLDVQLPGKDGIYWLKWLRQYHPHTPVIMASSRTNEDWRLLGLQSGAKDYVVKPFHKEELLIRIKNILDSSQEPQPSEFHSSTNSFRLDAKNQSVSKNGKITDLTPLEAQILKLLQLNVGRPVSREEIVNQIWGISYNPMGRNIDIHISQLRKKIEENPSKPEYIRTIRGKGYSLHLPRYDMMIQ